MSIRATEQDFEKLLEIRGDCREPELAFNGDKLGIDGYPELWNEFVTTFINELLKDEEDLKAAIAAEAQ